jgi:hypothetical protein
MPNELAFEGHVRGVITEYGLSEVESGAVVVNFAAKISDYWDSDAQQWIDCAESDYRVKGAVWIVRKDKTLSVEAAQSIIDHAGWDGNMESIVNGTWQPSPCSMSIKKETYKEQEIYRAGFLNAFDRVPGALGTVTEEKAKALQTQYGSALRALRGNLTRAAAPVPNGGSKPKPVARKAKAPPSFTPAAEAAAVAQSGVDEDGIPF